MPGSAGYVRVLSGSVERDTKMSIPISRLLSLKCSIACIGACEASGFYKELALGLRNNMISSLNQAILRILTGDWKIWPFELTGALDCRNCRVTVQKSRDPRFYGIRGVISIIAGSALPR